MGNKFYNHLISIFIQQCKHLKVKGIWDSLLALLGPDLLLILEELKG